ncbi:MAG TPA: trehalose-phosphatase [Candidatus Binataceae bacterium]|nr:trehalose-phosphatase [Candidatus Binataceae bacterium]
MSRDESRTAKHPNLPIPLPRDFFAAKLSHGRFLLCLDFDGTISELTNDPWKAVPLPRAKDALATLARFPVRLAIAIVSGRALDTLLKLLGLRDGLLFAGTHGLEVIGCDGVRHFTPGIERSLDDIRMMREFVAQSVPRDKGFIIEDKRVALTLNYRNARPEDAEVALRAFDEFVAQRPTLEILRGKMVHEAVPRGLGGKGEAVEFFMRETEIGGPSTSYFGDDTTDEDAFRALVNHHGIGVLVGTPRQSLARYRVEGPSQVADILEELARLVSA